MDDKLLRKLPWDCLEEILGWWDWAEINDEMDLWYRFSDDEWRTIRCYQCVLILFNCDKIPMKLRCQRLKIYGFNTISKIPEGLYCRDLWIDGWNTISEIPEGLGCRDLKIYGRNTISEIPEGLGCRNLRIKYRYWIQNGIRKV